MQIHELQPQNKPKTSKRVARGGKRGTYAGRGSKGQKSRSGSGGKNIVEKGRSSWVKRFPKLGGFTSTYLRNLVVKTSELESHFESGAVISIAALVSAGLAKNSKRGKSGKMQNVKVLYDTPVTKKFTIEGCRVSKTAKMAIEKAGGAVSGHETEHKKKMIKAKRES